MEKLIIEKEIYCSTQSQRYKIKDILFYIKRAEENNELEDFIEISSNSVVGNQYYKCTISRMVEETDEQLEIRKNKRYKQYLRLKKEFEN